MNLGSKRKKKTYFFLDVKAKQSCGLFFFKWFFRSCCLSTESESCCLSIFVTAESKWILKSLMWFCKCKPQCLIRAWQKWTAAAFLPLSHFVQCLRSRLSIRTAVAKSFHAGKLEALGWIEFWCSWEGIIFPFSALEVIYYVLAVWAELPWKVQQEWVWLLNLEKGVTTSWSYTVGSMVIDCVIVPVLAKSRVRSKAAALPSGALLIHFSESCSFLRITRTQAFWSSGSSCGQVSVF